jgi:hypothetical protein
MSLLRRAYSTLLRLQSPLRWLLAGVVFGAGAWFFNWQAHNPDYANGSFLIIRGMFLVMKWAACAGIFIAVLAMIWELRAKRDSSKGLQSVTKN